MRPAFLHHLRKTLSNVPVISLRAPGQKKVPNNLQLPKTQTWPETYFHLVVCITPGGKTQETDPTLRWSASLSTSPTATGTRPDQVFYKHYARSLRAQATRLIISDTPSELVDDGEATAQDIQRAERQPRAAHLARIGFEPHESR